MSSGDSPRRVSAPESAPSPRTPWRLFQPGRLWRIVTVGVIILCVTSALVTAAADGGGVPPPDPGVDRTYNETFRVLASNDVDPGKGSSTVLLYEYENGAIREVNRTVVTQPVQLQDDSIRPRDALVIATESDMYQTGLHGRVTVPYQDRWYTLEEWNRKWGQRALRIIPIYGADATRATDTEGKYTVEVRNPNGWWDPVYDAEVERTGNTLNVTNPETAMVHTAEYQTVIERKREIIHSLLQHSELAPSEAAARNTAVVPMDNGTEVFPTVDGASTSLVWRSGSHALVRDAYVGFIDVTPGVWYRSRYVTHSGQVNTHVPWDYRIEVPSDYSESGSCAIGNSTYPLTRWADYRLLGSNASVVNVTAGDITMQRWGPGEWTTLNYTSPDSEPRPLPVGEHTMTAQLRIEVELEKHYGVSSSRCSEWDRLERESRVVRINRSVPIETVNSDDLEIDVQVFDRPGEDIVSVTWTGEQGLAAGATGWEYVEVHIGEKTMYVTAPWRFFSITRNTHVQERTRGGTSELNASHSVGAQYPALLRYRMSPATVEVQADQSATQHVWWETTHVVETGSVAATPLPDTIVATENAEPSPLYDQYAGVLKSTDAVTGESVSVGAIDVWGFPVETTQTVTRYERSVLNVTIDDAAGTAEIFLQDESGTPISGRSIYLEGTDVSVVTTDSSGTATAEITNPIVRARFQGDDWRASTDRYYLSSQALAVSTTPVVVGAIQIVGYLNNAISNVALFTEWLALGVFAIFWMRFVRRRAV